MNKKMSNKKIFKKLKRYVEKTCGITINSYLYYQCVDNRTNRKYLIIKFLQLNVINFNKIKIITYFDIELQSNYFLNTYYSEYM